MIGDVHPDSHWLGYVKYYPNERGDRTLFGKTYRQNTVVSKAFGLLADRPECYIYSPVIGCVITGVPREDVVLHYSCRQALATLRESPELLDGSAVSKDLLAIIGWIVDQEAGDVIGVTGSFLVGVAGARSDIDLVCYGPRGYEVAKTLFTERPLIRPLAPDSVLARREVPGGPLVGAQPGELLLPGFLTGLPHHPGLVEELLAVGAS